MDLHLQGRTALITGASNGIGAEAARLLASEGVTVGVHGRNRERIDAVVAEIRAGGGTAEPLSADLSIDTEWDALADAANSALGQVDILVCNAGGRARLAPIGHAETTIENWRATFDTNITYAARLVQLLGPGMQERGYGRIILISSAAAQQPMGNQPDYGAAKAAVASLAVSASKWLRGKGVTVNAISPGAVLTPQLERYMTTVAEKKDWKGSLEEVERRIATGMMKIPVGRVGRTSEIAGMIAYLASPWADFITGANVHIDGGVIGTVT
jgi:NAD(P)-dependent dehydrogenase (short-subunit alcohol dehydrogenase family)